MAGPRVTGVSEPIGSGATVAGARRFRPVGPHYKWIVLTNTTLGALMATIDASIVLIALPAIFKGIGINPLAPGESSYFLWLLLGYMVVTTTLLVTFGRISDMFGRVRFYNLGFAIFTAGSTLLAFTPGTGNTGALELVIFRLIQGVGAGFLFANSAAILTDAFPLHQRGRALGINQIAAIAGSFIGLILGGVLAVINWRLVFLVSVPVGLIGTVWAYMMLRETATIRGHQRIDWAGNVTFAAGLTILLLAVTYGIEPYGGSPMGWQNPLVIAGIVLGILLLVTFIWIELHVDDPMFRLDLFKIRMFAAGNIAAFLSALGRGRLAVHADHLAAGDLAAAARLQLCHHPALGRYLHDAAAHRLYRHGTHQRLPLRSLRGALLLHLRYGAPVCRLYRSDLSAGELQLPGLRGAYLYSGLWIGAVYRLPIPARS